MITCFMEHHHFMANCSADWYVFLPSIIYFTCWTLFCAWFHPVPFITPCSNTYVFSASSFYLFFYLFNTCDEIPVRQISCIDYLCDYNRILKMGMIWCKKNISSLLTNKITYIANKILNILDILFNYFYNTMWKLWVELVKN